MMALMHILKKGKKNQLSSFLGQYEVDCHCKRKECVWTFISERAIKSFRLMRVHFGKPININSGFRCLGHNQSVDGKRYSDHTKGEALDIRPSDPQDLYELHEVAKNYFEFTYIDHEKGFIHCSKRA